METTVTQLHHNATFICTLPVLSSLLLCFCPNLTRVQNCSVYSVFLCTPPLFYHTWTSETGVGLPLVWFSKCYDGLNSVLALSSESCLLTAQDRSRVPLLALCMYYFVLGLVLYYVLLSYRCVLIFSYHEVSQVIWWVYSVSLFRCNL